MAQPQPEPKSTSWRDRYPVHPSADVFPMMNDDELNTLTDDIKARGLQSPITFYQDPYSKKDILLDGRNRLEALDRAGIDVNTLSFTWRETRTHIDPASYVISKNIHRRHLTKEQRAELIVKTIEAAKNDQATVARSFSPTVGKRGGSTKDPVLEQSVTEAAKHGISKRTVKRARAKLQGKPPTPRSTPPRAAARHAQERREAERLRDETVARAARFMAGAADAVTTAQDLRTRIERLMREARLRPAERKAQRDLALRVIDVGYKALARELHPDAGGSPDAMARLNVVRDHLKRYAS